MQIFFILTKLNNKKIFKKKEGSETKKIDEKNLEFVSINYSLEEIFKLAETGNLAREILEAWLKANAKNFSYVENKLGIKYTFEIDGKEYSFTFK